MMEKTSLAFDKMQFEWANQTEIWNYFKTYPLVVHIWVITSKQRENPTISV